MHNYRELAAILLFLGHNDVLVTGNRLLNSSMVRALSSVTSATIIFTPNLTIASPISTIATSTSHQPTNTTRHNLVIVDFGSDSHSLSSRSSDSPSSNSTSDPKERPEFYDEEIPTGLDTSKVLERSQGFSSKNASILFDKWISTIREVETKIRAKQWRKTFKNKRAVSLPGMEIRLC